MVSAVELMQNVQLACLAIIFTCMVIGNRRDRVLRLVWYGFSVLGLGGIIDLAAPHLPRWVGYGINYDAAPISFGLINLAIATFVGRHQWTRWLSLGLVLAGLPVYLHCAGSLPAQTQSLAVLDFVMAVQTGCTAWVILCSEELSTRIPRFTMSALLAVFAVDGLYRSGVVALLNVSPAHFLPAAEFVTASIYIVAISILPLNIIWMMHARTRDHLKAESHVDPLTSLLNRRGLAEAADRELARYVRGRQNFAVAIADIDHFKELNDKHGHPYGDEVLRRVAALFHEQLRQSDVVSRTGGEEFVFLLPVTPEEETFMVLDRLRIALENTTMLLDKSLEVGVTISIGMTNTCGRRNLRWVDLEREADTALYAAKHAGRNRSVASCEMQMNDSSTVLAAVERNYNGADTRPAA